MSDKKSFVFYETAYEPIKELSKEDQLMFYEAIIRYGLYGELPEFTGKDKAIWYLIQFGIDEAKNRREKNINNGLKGGRPSNTTETEENPTITQNNPTIPNKTKNNPLITEENPTKPNHNLNVNVNVNGNVNATATANNNAEEQTAAAETLNFDKQKKEFDGAICLLFNTPKNNFTPDFTIGVLKLCEQNNVTNYTNYLKFVYDSVKKKNPANFSGLFYKMAQSADVMNEFILQFKPQTIQYSKCVCCNADYDPKRTAVCPKCGFDLTRKDEPGYIQEWRDFMQSRGFG